jgi:hypothetical protein
MKTAMLILSILFIGCDNSPEPWGEGLPLNEVWILEEGETEMIGGTIFGNCWYFVSVQSNIRYRGCMNKRVVDIENFDFAASRDKR